MVCDLNNDVSTPDLINPDLIQDFISLIPTFVQLVTQTNRALKIL